VPLPAPASILFRVAALCTITRADFGGSEDELTLWQQRQAALGVGSVWALASVAGTAALTLPGGGSGDATAARRELVRRTEEVMEGAHEGAEPGALIFRVAFPSIALLA
jgi:hypothetical protein